MRGDQPADHDDGHRRRCQAATRPSAIGIMPGAHRDAVVITMGLRAFEGVHAARVRNDSWAALPSSAP